MKRTDTVIVGVALIILVAAFVMWQKNASQTVQLPAQENSQTQTAGAGGASQNGTYTMADVAQHKDGTSCWSVINGNVYDLTAWIPQHPGGPDKILAICGIDGSAPFNRQHGGASLQQQILAGFKIGTLAQ